MKRVLLGLTAVVAIGIVVAVAAGAAGMQRSDCPGKVTCPLTGEEVCKDKCPLASEVRDDCPGKVSCPLTGEEVCQDQCPLAVAETAAAQPTRGCCQVDK